MTNQSLRIRFKLDSSKQTIISKIIKDTLKIDKIIIAKTNPVPNYKPYWA